MIMIKVDAAPPAKGGGLSIRNPEHEHYARVEALRQAMRQAIEDGQEPYKGIGVIMIMHRCRAKAQEDPLNAISGVADTIQERCDTPDYRYAYWLIDDDKNIRQFHYMEESAKEDSYVVILAPLA